jgi:RNA polymerase sigma factor (sigma-70 family)
MSDVTRILSAIEQGDLHAADQLLPLVYDELRKLAVQKLAKEKPGQTLQPTALVHEAYLRLVTPLQSPPSHGGNKQGSPPLEQRDKGGMQHWDNRGHFFAAAAEAMRRILIDGARHRHSQRHGGAAERHSLETLDVAAPVPDDELLAVNEALERLRQVDPAKAELVKLRYFAGLTIPEAAQALGISVTTANRHWAFARAWLHEELAGGPESDSKASQRKRRPA